MTYTLVEDGRAIRCEICGRTSHNPNDVQYLYCGYCRAWHRPNEDRAAPAPDQVDGARLIV